MPAKPFQNHIICVGAVYIDTILTVPHFPHEDSKLRANKITRRRGGNTANTLEVLAQLIEHDPTPSTQALRTPNNPGTTLHLITVLPGPNSTATTFITSSLPHVQINDSSIFRPEHEDSASSYIIQSLETLSRTIVSVNPLPEMTVDEFKYKINVLIGNKSTSSNTTSTSQATTPHPQQYLIHFEGRIPEITLACIHHLRQHHHHHQHASFKISVECEKPERKGMSDVAALADVVFYSRLWAEGNGFSDARVFLEDQRERTREGAILCCTWGAGGATIVQKRGVGRGVSVSGGDEWASVGAWGVEGHGDGRGKEVVDTIGAGDTFIAGMIFAINNHADWTLERKLEFANEVAGRKVLQDGFKDLGRKMWDTS